MDESVSNNIDTQNQESEEDISEKGLRIFFIIQLVLLVVVFLMLLTTGSYGWTLFLIIPFSLGLTAGVYAKTYRSGKLLKGLFWTLLIVSAICGLLLLAGIEGAICILMAAGIIFLPATLGMLVGYLIRNAHRVYGLALILLLNTSAYIYDKNDTDHIRSLTSESIQINASGGEVWNVLTNDVEYTPHENFFFRSGVSYPTTMQLSKREGKCFLSCRLNNGYADLPVVELDSLKRLRFTMPSDVPPMRELSIYDSIHAEHLKGYFLPHYGEFKITPVNDIQCILTAETSYSYKITPVFYWQWWSDYLVNTMHRHVLQNMKSLSEKDERKK